MMNMIRDRHEPTPQDYVTVYALYAIVLALVAAIIMIWPTTVVAALGVVAGHAVANRAIYLTTMYLMGLGLLIVAIGAEPYLRNGIAKGKVLDRFRRLALPLSITAAAGLVLRALLIPFLPG